MALGRQAQLELQKDPSLLTMGLFMMEYIIFK